jgi:hypothetical protein
MPAWRLQLQQQQAAELSALQKKHTQQHELLQLKWSAAAKAIAAGKVQQQIQQAAQQLQNPHDLQMQQQEQQQAATKLASLQQQDAKHSAALQRLPQLQQQEQQGLKQQQRVQAEIQQLLCG